MAPRTRRGLFATLFLLTPAAAGAVTTQAIRPEPVPLATDAARRARVRKPRAKAPRR